MNSTPWYKTNILLSWKNNALQTLTKICKYIKLIKYFAKMKNTQMQGSGKKCHVIVKNGTGNKNIDAIIWKIYTIYSLYIVYARLIFI